MSDYTPNMMQVRACYAHYIDQQSAIRDTADAFAEFDRWLAAHDAEVIEQAVGSGKYTYNPYWDYPACGCITCDDEWRSRQDVLVRMSRTMIVCKECGNKRCPKANHHDNACTRSNEPGQPGSAYPKVDTSWMDGLTQEEISAEFRKCFDTAPEEHNGQPTT